MVAHRVTLIGYFAVLDRLFVQTLPVSGDGIVGELQTPTLTCDAVLIAMHLWEAGMAATVVGSDPGGRTLKGRKATDFVASRTGGLILGRDCGQPYELEIRSSNLQRTWVSDPSAGLASLGSIECPRQEWGTEFVYVDAYPWLEPATYPLATVISEGSRLLFVNLGQTAESAMTARAAPWLEIGGDRTVIQVSVPGQRDAASRRRLMSDASTLGAHLVVVTAGDSGLGVVSPDCAEWLDAEHIEPLDTSGAGAAVSAAYLRAILNDELDDLEAVALAMSRAGAAQCEVDGGLPSTTLGEWESHVRI